ARQLSAIHADLKRESSRFSEVLGSAFPGDDDYNCCAVKVTIVGGNPATLNGLRVYYTLNGLFRQPPPIPPGVRPFSELGSGRTEKVRAKNYQFWAAPDGQPERPATAPTFVSVDIANVVKDVTLLLRR